ncbi:hypothetical protein EE612_033337, partial [Oryza sativa]
RGAPSSPLNRRHPPPPPPCIV